ncbi:MAG: hypothetical protein EU539_13025 [Promethearchaeota archaeon]|nr:MAG: hypothetical protein EU539_13025 [Candidatus Lokiarchaeota archaeon]
MSDNQDKEINNDEEDDYETYLQEISQLKSDFSDLEDLELEEIEAMQEAIFHVKEVEDPVETIQADEKTLEVAEIEETTEPPEIPKDITPSEELQEVEQVEKKLETQEISQEIPSSEELQEVNEVQETLETKEEMMVDFSDIGKMDLQELIQMQQAVNTVKQEESVSTKTKSSQQSSSSLSEDIETRIQQELQKKREKEKKEIITEEDFLEYIKDKRDKIWYHALYYLVFEVEDHTASKFILYDILKQDTSKSPINPIPEHQFYFGLGYILRLKVENTQIVRYQTGSKFKINYDINKLKEMLEKTGEPIITKPEIEDKKKQKMFREFLEDDFSDL